MLSRPEDFDARLSAAVAEFGAAIREPLAAGVGRAEDQIGDPVARLVRRAGRGLGLRVVTHAEAPLREYSVRPDYAVEAVGGNIGYIEIKQPGKGADPTAWSSKSHDGRQWDKLKLLPNILYTDGREWALYRDGKREGVIARLAGNLDRAGKALRPADGSLARVLAEFLWWAPQPPRNLRTLVRVAARLCRYLREEIVEILEHERATQGIRPFTTLADEWRKILFPRMNEVNEFADAYAQTVTFALLLARSVGVSFEGRDLSDIGRKLGKQHALIGRALRVLSDPAGTDSIIVIETLRRVIGAVDWDRLDTATGHAHALLYETFLEEYDRSLRRRSGSYYTPDRLARAMVRFTDQILRAKLDRLEGYAADDVIVVDPAMGTGTFLIEILELVAETVTARQGPGACAQRLRELFQRRIIGFERQVTPYAVAELRLHEALKTRYRVEVPEQEMRFLADTFENPDIQELAFGSMYAELRLSRQEANRVKRDVPVMVVIGNPPYLDRAHSRDPAPWIEDRRDHDKPTDISHRPSLDEFRQRGRLDYKLAATWVFFWRWAIWKAFEAHPRDPAGVIAFITPASYLAGGAFAGMRAYLRHVADEAWIINVSPEGFQPPVRTRIFPKVQQPLCIAVFARYGASGTGIPARVHYRAVTGTPEEKLHTIQDLRLGDSGWQLCPAGWKDAFLPTAHAGWLQYPALSDMLTWQAPGLKAKRTWVIAPSADVLKLRWAVLVNSPPEDRDLLMKTSRDRNADSLPPPIPGQPRPSRPLRREDSSDAQIVSYAYRSFDRQYLILDPRVVDFPSPDLWRAAGPHQVFTSEQHTHPLKDGPGLTFAAYVPDMDHFQGHNGGRVLPLYRDATKTHASISQLLLDYLTQVLAHSVNPEDVLAYIAAVVAHPAFTRRYQADLLTPGIRVPLSKDWQLWVKAIEIGREVIWLHTFGARFPDPGKGRPRNAAPRLLEQESPQIVTEIPYTSDDMPDTVSYEEETQTLVIGTTGRVTPVPSAVWNYTVGGMPVLRKWIGYRLKNPRRRPAASPLDTINTDSWTHIFNNDLLDLLHVLGRLVYLHPDQAALLEAICATSLISVTELHHAGILPVPVTEAGPMPYTQPDSRVIF